MQITCYLCGGQNFLLGVVELVAYDETGKQFFYENTELWCVNEECQPKGMIDDD